MSEVETGKALQLLDLMLEFFVDDANWTRGRYHDGHGRRCLVGAVLHLSGKHHLPAEPVMSLLHDAMPPRVQGLIHFNDHRCDSVAELRSVIAKARRFAQGNAEEERAAAAVKRWLLAELKKERAARAAAGDKRETYIVSPRAPDESAIAPARLAA